jgi:UPF0271 protein
VLLNIDLGELDGEPDALYGLAHVASIACGGHAGDDASMSRALALCLRHGARIGAHPSYPDRDRFGRAPMTMQNDALRATVAEQCARLGLLASAAGARIDYVKAHGALYHAARDDEGIAEALLAGVTDALGRDVTVIGPAQGKLASLAARQSLRFAREGFADRGTRADGALVPRGEPGAVLTDPQAAATRAREMAKRRDVDTVCVHGDTPGAVAIATAVRQALDGLARHR